MDIKPTVLMFLHKEGKVAEYQRSEHGYFDLIGRPDGYIWFDNQIYHPVSMPPDSYTSKAEAYKAAMDYHETEGCKLYLELYPAPEKGEWIWIAQDYSGRWWGYKRKPVIRKDGVVWTAETGGYMSDDPILESPPNPFWRKTLR